MPCSCHSLSCCAADENDRSADEEDTAAAGVIFDRDRTTASRRNVLTNGRPVRTLEDNIIMLIVVMIVFYVCFWIEMEGSNNDDDGRIRCEIFFLGELYADAGCEKVKQQGRRTAASKNT